MWAWESGLCVQSLIAPSSRFTVIAVDWLLDREESTDQELAAISAPRIIDEYHKEGDASSKNGVVLTLSQGCHDGFALC